MKFEHTIRIDAPKERVNAFLADFERAALCLPGVQDVHAAGDGEYEGRIRVRLGPLGFNIGGRARPALDADGNWSVQAEGNDRRVGAGVKAALAAQIAEVDAATTEVQVTADVVFSGKLAGLGQPLIKRKSDAMVQEFAENLRRAIAAGPD